ncbi:MarR family winged helix-turn-helix transcriptional regulator [Sedimentitalea xiamensis]|nr:MarR family winged helix-turn-helix transcriptional regulator [Sedimentitalea xiamensis]
MPMTHFDLTGFLPYQLAVLSERVSKALSSVYTEQHGLSVADWRVLVHTAKEGSVSVRDIHRTVNLEKPRVSRSVSKLQDRGYLAKQADETDKRLVKISLTERGNAVLDEILSKALAFETELTSALSQKDLDRIFRIAGRLHQKLDSMGTDPTGNGTVATADDTGTGAARKASGPSPAGLSETDEGN